SLTTMGDCLIAAISAYKDAPMSIVPCLLRLRPLCGAGAVCQTGASADVMAITKWSIRASEQTAASNPRQPRGCGRILNWQGCVRGPVGLPGFYGRRLGCSVAGLGWVGPSVPPEVLEAIWREGGVAHGRSNRPCVVAIV